VTLNLIILYKKSDQIKKTPGYLRSTNISLQQDSGGGNMEERSVQTMENGKGGTEKGVAKLTSVLGGTWRRCVNA